MDNELLLEIGIDADDAGDELDDLNKKIDETGDAAKDAEGKSGGFGKALGVLGDAAKLAGVGVLAFGGFMAGAFKAAADEQTGIDRLNTTLKNSVPNWDGNTKAVEDYITAKTKSGYADDKLRDSLNFLVGQTGDLTEAQNLQATAMDLARAKGIDLETATKAVGKVDADSIGILKKLGITVDDHATKEQALAAIRAQTAGQADKYAQSAAGSMDRVQNALGDAFETIGGAALGLVSGPLAGFADWLQSPEVTAGIQAVADGIGVFLKDAFDKIGGVITAIMPTIQGIWSYLTSPEVVSAVQTMADVIGTTLVDGFNLLGAAITAAWPTIQTLFTFLKDNAGIALGALAGVILAVVVPAFIGWATTMLTVTLPALAATMAPIIAAAAPFIALGLVIGALWMAFENNFLGIRDLVVPVVDAIVQAVSRWWTEIQPQAIAAWNAISSTAVNAWNWIQSTIVAGVMALVDGWNTNWGGMRTIVEDAWNLISGIVSTAWGIVSGLITTGMQLLSGDWSGAWGTVQTTLSDAWNNITTNLIPTALDLLGKLLFDFLPKLGGILLEWAGAFFNWVWTDIIPKLPGWLGSLVNVIWTFISTNAPILLGKLGEWTQKFLDWVMNDVVPKIPGWLGNIAGALWTWVSNTAKDLGSKLVNEWLPSFWGWITGSDGVLAKIGGFLGQIWTNITTWIGDTAKNILNAVVDIGKNLVQGIWNGISGAWKSMMDWLGGLIRDQIPQFIKDWLGIKSPSQVMIDIFQYLPLGMQAGVEKTWGTFRDDLHAKVQKLCDDDVLAPIKKLCDEDLPGAVKDSALPALGGNIAQIVRDGFEGTWPMAAQAMLAMMTTSFDAMWGEATARAQQIYDMMSNTGETYGASTHVGNNPASGGTGSGGVTAYARGGYFAAGRPMLVGEDGPELMVPSGSGRIIPNDQLTSSSGGGQWAGGGGAFAPTILVMLDGVPVNPERVSVAVQEWNELKGFAS